MLNDLVEDQLEAAYLDPLEEQPSDRALWIELARVYVSLTRYDEAIRSAYARLIDLGGSDAQVFNHLGIANYLKGEIEQAGYFFKQAADLVPDDEGFRRNYDRAMMALGKIRSENRGVSSTDRHRWDEGRDGRSGSR